MNYELAKQLKDAGYPFKKDTYSAFAHIEFNYELPTLSELIEACGEEEQKYHERFLLKTPYKNNWVAQYGEDMNDGSGFVPIELEGSTPEEAVANLWLKLNKK